MAGLSGNIAEIKIDNASIKTSTKSVKLNVRGKSGDYTVFGSEWENSVPTGNSWELSADAVLDSSGVYSTLFGKLNTTVTVAFYPEGNSTGKKYYSGSGVLTSLDQDAPADDLIGITFTIKGDGALTESTGT